MRRFYFLQIFLLMMILSACKSNNEDIDLSNVDVQFSISRFENDLFTLNPDSLKNSVPLLQKKYRSFFDLFGEKLIGIGPIDDPNFVNYLHSFISNQMVKKAYLKVSQEYSSFEVINSELENAFKRYHYYFPEKAIPAIYTFVSGYNQSIVISDSLLAIGLDRYLGSNHSDYVGLGIPKYLAFNMRSEKISSDCMRSLAIGEFPFNDSIDNLACNMIYEGMLMYFTHKMLPDQPDSLIFGFTPDQYKWCKKNEKMIWTYFVENKMLFSTDSFFISKMVNSAPFTSGFPKESPGRTAVWIGYRIIQSFVKSNSDVTLPMLMNINDYQQILNKSKYQP